MTISQALRRQIRSQAGYCCEYCRVTEDNRLSTFQVDHIIPLKHGGTDDPSNLCLACLKCNSFKGSNVAGLDPATGDPTRLFDPRRQSWRDHFEIEPDGVINGLTPEGRTTVDVLRLNDLPSLVARRVLILTGEYPC
ncbi:MAG: HNH endonuclease [Chloroflexi bacterium]|nr:HNH endonuclease [Chloroflexota bacterium]